MSNIYFRRRAVVPPTGTNGIAVFNTSNHKIYLDGELYGGGDGTLSALTIETWWSGVTDIEIDNGYANIDLKEFARQADVKQLIEDVLVIKNELALDDTTDPSGDPRSAIDVLTEDLSKVNTDLQKSKISISANTSNIANNTSAITVLSVDLSKVSANTVTNAKNIAIAVNRISDLESREEDLTHSAETIYNYEKDSRSRLETVEGNYISAITYNGKSVDIEERVAKISGQTSDLTELSAKVDNTVTNLSTLSGEVGEFEDEVAGDVDTLSEQLADKLSGISLSGVKVPVTEGVAQLSDVSISVSGQNIVLGTISGGSVTAKLPCNTYSADESTLTLSGDTFALNQNVIDTINYNFDSISEIQETYISGVSVNGSVYSPDSTSIVTLPISGGSLVYNSENGELTLVDVFGVSGKPVELGLHRILTSAYFDEPSKNIVLKFNDDAEDIMKINVSALVDTYNADEEYITKVTESGKSPYFTFTEKAKAGLSSVSSLTQEQKDSLDAIFSDTVLVPEEEETV